LLEATQTRRLAVIEQLARLESPFRTALAALAD
jgi:hypothetical protein